MNNECPNLMKCQMFKFFQSDFAKQIYLTLYCQGNFTGCARKKLKDAGKEVPENLLPDGQYL